MLEIRKLDFEINEKVVVFAVGSFGEIIVSKLEIEDAEVFYVDKEINRDNFIESILSSDIRKMDIKMYKRKCAVIVARLDEKTETDIIFKLIEIANENNVPIIGLFSFSYEFEDKFGNINAKKFLEQISDKIDSMYIFENNNMLKNIDRKLNGSNVKNVSKYVIQMIIKSVVQFCEKYPDNLYRHTKNNIQIKVYDEFFIKSMQKQELINFYKKTRNNIEYVIGISANSMKRLGEIKQEFLDVDENCDFYMDYENGYRDVIVLVYMCKKA